VIGRGKFVAVSGREEAKNAQMWQYKIIVRKHYRTTFLKYSHFEK
jgi:hypothetical protein